MLLVYIPVITARHQYIFDFLFNELLQTEVVLTDDLGSVEAHSGPVMVYAKEPAANKLFFKASGLLEEQGIKAHQVEGIDYGGLPALFPVEQSTWPFDPFAASFYLITRYEEYLPFTPDKHGRFEAGQSIALQKGFLHLPLIDIWAYQLKKLLQEKFPKLHFKQRQFNFQPTLDIDNAFAYLHKGWLRSLAAIVYSAIKGNYQAIKKRWQVLNAQQPDPFDTYAIQALLHKQYRLDPVYFILLGDYATYDKNLSYKNQAFRSLIKELSAKANIGIHPSYVSNTVPGKMEEELQRLEAITGKKISKSRQHYLKLQLPHTYRRLIAAGITEDYSMGYAASPGFRASTCTPFYFYDLEAEAATTLKVYPFVMMDTTWLHMKLTPQEALALVEPLIKKVKEVEGYCCVLFHNESIGNSGEWSGWGHTYESVIKQAVYKEDSA